MCLDYYKKINVKNNIGYKVVEVTKIEKNKKEYHPIFQDNGKILKPNIWLREKYFREKYEKDNDTINFELGYMKELKKRYYPKGFHFFIKMKDAKKYLNTFYNIDGNYKIVKIEFKNIVMTGQQEGLDCAVAKQIRII